MDKRTLFTLAHKMTKAVIQKGDSYAFTFGLCLKAIKGGYKMTSKKGQIDLSAVIEAVNAAFADVQARFKARFSDDDIKPTRDKDGRLHAPCDGYIFEGTTYLGGQYLPFEMAGPQAKARRFMVTVAKRQELKTAIESTGIASVSFGQAFELKGYDVPVCYAYVEGSKFVTSALDSLIPTSGKALALADDGFETGATWETSLGMLCKKVFAGPDYVQVEAMKGKLSDMMHDDVMQRIQGKKPKTVKVTIGWHYATYFVG